MWGRTAPDEKPRPSRVRTDLYLALTRAATCRPPRGGIVLFGSSLMWLLLKAFVLRMVVGRTIGGLFGLLLMLLVPVAGVLKFIGLPLLIILGFVGAPIFLLLGAIGLPMLLVLGIGGMLLLFVGLMLAVGMLAIKIALPIILVVWLIRWMRRPRHDEPIVDPGVEPGASTL